MVTRIPRATTILAGLAVGCVAATALHAATDRPIYVCHWATPVIFSDRPCGPLAARRVLHVPDPDSDSHSGTGTGAQTGSGRAASIASAPSKDATRPRTEPHVADARPDDRDERCRRLREERRRLDDRMRDGYSAHEAARLWNRWRELDAKIYAARC